MAPSKDAKKDSKATKTVAKKAAPATVKKEVSKPVRKEDSEKKSVVPKAKSVKSDALKILKVPAKFTYGTGKRKSAIAKVWLFPGSGQIQVNNLSTQDYFQSPLLIENASKPLEPRSKPLKKTWGSYLNPFQIIVITHRTPLKSFKNPIQTR